MLNPSDAKSGDTIYWKSKIGIIEVEFKEFEVGVLSGLVSCYAGLIGMYIRQEELFKSEREIEEIENQ